MRPRRILPLIVCSQFAGTSLWLAGNAVLPGLTANLAVPPEFAGLLASSVQLGFIAGTLCFAVFAVANRVAPRALFLLCSLLGALCTLAIAWLSPSISGLLGLRLCTGVCLAGIYPVGMRIAAGWYERDLGSALGYLVGALVLGTALPHLLTGFGPIENWRSVLFAVAALASAGGVAVYFAVPDGPFARVGARFDPRALGRAFAEPAFRRAAFGYFGHMWELYAFWVHLPRWLASQFGADGLSGLGGTSLLVFTIIGAGAIGCAAGGALSLRYGSLRIAFVQLLISGLLCLTSPWLPSLPAPLALTLLVLWGITVVGDSPQFSALVARTAPKDYVGSALTLTTSIGFAITIPSIELTGRLLGSAYAEWAFFVLALGPAVGLVAMRGGLRSK